MKIVACYKCVPDDQDISAEPGKPLDLSRVGWKVGTYDLNAVEAGMQLAEQVGGGVQVLSAAGAKATESKMKKAILARGPEQLCVVQDDALASADGLATAKALAAGVKRIGDVDLVLCGEGSGDEYAQQVGLILGSILGWSTLNAVKSIEQAGDGLRVERELEGSVEVLEVGLPAVLCVTSDINTPRIAGMKDILAAGKKPAVAWSLEEVGAAVHNTVEVLEVVAPDQAQRENVIIEGTGDEAIEGFIDLVRKAL